MQASQSVRKRFFALLLLAVAVLAAAGLARPANAVHPSTAADTHRWPDTEARKYPATGQLVVRWREGEAIAHLSSATLRQQVKILKDLPQLQAALLQVPAGMERAILAELQRDPFVQYVEPNQRVFALEVPNDPKWPEQWALPKIGAPQAWDTAHCQGTVVAVLDTGVYLEHPDLQNSLWTNPDEIPGNYLDDDHNGKVDDVHGWHFYQVCDAVNCQPYENGFVDDENGHGTHVTGIIAAETNNGVGVAGVSWGARVMAVRVLDRDGQGFYSDIAAAILYATDTGAQVINLSFGGDEPSQLLQDAVNYAYERGVLLVAAAGNDGGAQILYPAACNNVIAVASTDSSDRRSGFSNHGPQVDIAAPGDSIVSTWLQPYLYFYKRGTSMATPHVAGAAALLWSWRPDFSNAQIEDRLESQADDVNADTYPGPDPYLGWGRLNLQQALAGLPQGPTPTPTGTPTATPIITPTTTPTATPEPTTTRTPTATLITTPSATPTATPEPTLTATPTASPSPTPSRTPARHVLYLPIFHWNSQALP